MTSSAQPERAAISRRLLCRSVTTGQIRLPAVPALLDEIEAVCVQTFAPLGVSFTDEERGQLRNVLADQLLEAYETSPRAEIVIGYEVPVGLSVTYNVTHQAPRLEDVYDEWVSTRQPPYFGTEPDARVMALAVAGCPVLDIGAGTGRNALALARRGHPVDAVELSSRFAAIIRDASEQESLPLRVLEGDVFSTSIALRDDYGLVVLSEVVSDFRGPAQLRQMFELAAACLAPGGELVFNVFVPIRGYTPDAAARELGLQVYSAIFTTSELAEGVKDLPLSLVADDSVYDYEQRLLPEGAWPPTSWYVNWVSGLDVFDLPRQDSPIEMRWLVYRKMPDSEPEQTQTMAETPTTDVVARQYEQWSYPAPIADLDDWLKNQWQWFDPSHAHTLFWPDRPYTDGMRILVAGCGTSQAAAMAHTNPTAQVVGIDVSEASLAHHQTLIERHALRNLQLHRLAIEEVDQLASSFDLIVCTGVLHHLSDPLAGLKALASCLYRDGVIAVMLYAKYGRIGVELLQSVLRDLNLDQSAQSVELTKQAVAGLESDHPLAAYLSIAPDLDYDAGIVDTFLHGRERSYSIPDCLELVEAAGLAFHDLAHKAPYCPAAFCSNPFYEHLASLPTPQRWSLMERLNTTNGCHWFTACRRDRPPESYRIDLNDANAGAYRPSFRYRCGLQGNSLKRPNGLSELVPAHLFVLRLIDGRRTIEQIIRECASVLGALQGIPAERHQFVLQLLEHLRELDVLQFELPNNIH